MLRIAGLGARQVDGLRAHEFDIGARGIEMGVVGHHVALLAHDVEQNAFGGAALVGGNDVTVAEDVLHRVAEVIEALAAGVAFVAFHDAGPLMSGHGAGAGIGEQVDQNVVGRKQEQVVVGGAQQFLALLAGSPANGLNALDAEGLNNRLGSHGKNPC